MAYCIEVYTSLKSWQVCRFQVTGRHSDGFPIVGSRAGLVFWFATRIQAVRWGLKFQR